MCKNILQILYIYFTRLHIKIDELIFNTLIYRYLCFRHIISYKLGTTNYDDKISENNNTYVTFTKYDVTFTN